MLGANQGIAIFQKYSPDAPAIVLGYRIDILLDVIKVPYSEFNSKISIAESAIILGATYS